jgi:hypothetical protein
MTTDAESTDTVQPQTGRQVDMRALEAQMLSHLAGGQTLQAILRYHDTMVVDVSEARAVVRILANLHGIRFRPV